MCRVSPEYELPRLDVPGGHGAPAHPLQPGDGEGETAARLLVQRLVLGRAETGGTVYCTVILYTLYPELSTNLSKVSQHPEKAPISH